MTTQRLKTQSSSEEESEEDTSGVDEIMVNIPFRTQFIPDVFTDSREAAKALFRLLIHPVSTDQFFRYAPLYICVSKPSMCVCRDVWEKKPVVVHRNQEQYNNGWFSAQDLDTVLREVSGLFCVVYFNKCLYIRMIWSLGLILTLLHMKMVRDKHTILKDVLTLPQSGSFSR